LTSSVLAQTQAVSKKDLYIVGQVQILNSNGIPLAFRAFDNGEYLPAPYTEDTVYAYDYFGGTFDPDNPAYWVLANGEINLPGYDVIQNNGGGHLDFVAYAPTMDLSALSICCRISFAKFGR